MNAASIYQQTNDDLSGVNGADAWEETLAALVRLQEAVMTDLLHVFGSANVKVLQIQGDVLISLKS